MPPNTYKCQSFIPYSGNLWHTLHLSNYPPVEKSNFTCICQTVIKSNYKLNYINKSDDT